MKQLNRINYTFIILLNIGYYFLGEPYEPQKTLAVSILFIIGLELVKLHIRTGGNSHTGARYTNSMAKQ